VQRIGFGRRLFLILFLFALIPAALLTAAWSGVLGAGLPFVSSSSAWDSVAATGARAVAAMRSQPLDSAAAAAVRAHEQELASSVTQARRFRFLAGRAAVVVLTLGIIALAVLALVASRVAGHLSRQLSRPLDELVGWTSRIARGDAVPPSEGRGAPEFGVLRERMRAMAEDLASGRARAIEAERLRVFRETARQVAHELKNPLTPIRFAIARLRRESPPALAETVDVLEVESARIDQLAKDFAQLGRMSEGPASDVDLAELARYAARASVPPHIPVRVVVEEPVPLVRGQHDALARALSNVLLNAVDACADGGAIEVRVEAEKRAPAAGNSVRVVVRDEGSGIPADQLATIWDPYVTHKSGGTGLGLAIARQTIESHGGAVEARSAAGSGTEIHFVLPALAFAPALEV
jgi:signal transduction histidine kinase